MPTPVPNLLVDLLDATKSLSQADILWLHDHLASLAHVLGINGTLDVRLIDDREMVAAHERFLGIAETTDVITFDALDLDLPPVDRLWDQTSAPRAIQTSLLVCVDEAARQSVARKIPLRNELLLYCLHGVLHSVGWDDQEDKSYRAMHAFEDLVLQSLNVGVVFGSDAADDA